MKKVLSTLLAISLFICCVISSNATTNMYGFSAFNGGTAGALDKLADMSNGDMAIGIVYGKLYSYTYDSSCTNSTSLPAKIQPTNGIGCWEITSNDQNYDAYYYGGNYTDEVLLAAANAIGTTANATLVISQGEWTIDGNVDLSSYKNINFVIPQGTHLNISANVTLTFPNTPDIGNYQVFYCANSTAKVAGLKKSNPIWFGAKIDFNGSTGTDDAAAWQSALDSIATTGGVLDWPIGTSYVASTLIWPNNGTNAYAIRLIGNSPQPFDGVSGGVAGGVSAIWFGGTGYLFDMRNGDDSNLIFHGSIENGHLYGGDTPDTSTGYGTLTATQSGMNFYRITKGSLRNLQIKGFGIYGIYVASNIYYSIIDGVRCYWNGIGFYAAEAYTNNTVFMRCAFSKSKTTGLAIGSPAGYPVNVAYTWFEGNGEYGIAITNPAQVNLDHTYYENNVSTDISITSKAMYNTIVNLIGNFHYQTNGTHYALSCTNCAEINSIGCDYDKVYHSSTKATLYVTGISAKGIMAGNAWPKVYGVVPIAEARKADFLWIDATNPSLSIAPNPASYATTIADGSIVFNSNYDAFGGLLGWQIGQTGAGASSALSGVTANTTAGSKTVTVNKTDGLQVGATIEIVGETWGAGASAYTVISNIASNTSITVGTAAKNGVNAANVSYHTATYKEIAGVIYEKTTANSTTVGDGEDILETVTIPAGMMTTTSGFKVFAAGTKTNNNGTKLLKFYFGSTAIEVFPATQDVLDWQFEAQVFNRAATNSQIIVWKFLNTNDTAGNATVYAGVNAASEATANAVTMKLTATCAHQDDIVTLGLWLVEPK